MIKLTGGSQIWALEMVGGQFQFESHFWVKLYILYQQRYDLSYEIASTGVRSLSFELLQTDWGYIFSNPHRWQIGF